jgi:hypothetical protein
MVAALALVAFLAAFGLFWWRAEPLVRRWLAVREQQAGLAPPSGEQVEATLRRRGVPAGLLAACYGESEPWAREQSMQALLERYEAVSAAAPKGTDAWGVVGSAWMADGLRR